MEFFSIRLPVPLWPLALFSLGTILGSLLDRYTRCLLDHSQTLIPRSCRHCSEQLAWWDQIPLLGYVVTHNRCRSCKNITGAWSLSLSIAVGLLFSAFLIAFLQFDCQKTPEVRPDSFWWNARIISHLILFALLIVTVGTDLHDCTIPGDVTIAGSLIGLCLATFSGQSQIMHIWVDWNREIPGLQGPYIPNWIDQHRHWHGLAWSTAGLVTAAGMTWLVRKISSIILGQEALGFGDVMLMGMIGSFLGWQPIVFVFLLAPFCGLLIGIIIKLFTNKPYVPYGPFLSAATVIVLFTWRWLWMMGDPTQRFSVRHLFGDARSLAILTGISIVAFVVLLGMIRLYRMIPVKRNSEETPPSNDRQ